jgi:hypothetical protein
MADNKFRPAKFLTFQKSQCKRPFIVIMTDVLVCQTEGFQAVWRFLHPFRNFQIMTHYHTTIVVRISLWCALLFPILILIIAVTMTRMTKIENGVS